MIRNPIKDIAAWRYLLATTRLFGDSRQTGLLTHSDAIGHTQRDALGPREHRMPPESSDTALCGPCFCLGDTAAPTACILLVFDFAASEELGVRKKKT